MKFLITSFEEPIEFLHIRGYPPLVLFCAKINAPTKVIQHLIHPVVGTIMMVCLLLRNNIPSRQQLSVPTPHQVVMHEAPSAQVFLNFMLLAVDPILAMVARTRNDSTGCHGERMLQE